MSRWIIQLANPQWGEGQSLYCQRWFQTPEAAAMYAESLIDIPEIWVRHEGVLCKLLEASDPEKIEYRIQLED